MDHETSVMVSDQRITVRWLLDHVPVAWWWAVGGSVVTIASGGYFVGTMLGADLSAREVAERWREIEAVGREITVLERQRDRLRAEITALNVERDTAAMTDEDVRAELAAKWMRK